LMAFPRGRFRVAGKSVFEYSDRAGLPRVSVRVGLHTARVI